MKYKRSIGILAFFSCLPFSSSYGQSQLEEITVTAERRSESIEKTPLAISAFTGADLKDYGIEKVSDLVSQVPGLRLQEDLMFPSYFIRGAGLQSETTNLNDQDVGVYLDDVFLGAPQLSRGQLFDIDRVEVLKGPQGTLFGKNTSAGLIQYVSKPPTQDYQGYFDYGYGSWARKTINAAVGGPIDDKIRFRVAVRDILSDGWQTDVVTNRHYGSEDNFSLRAQLDADLTDNLLASFKVDYNRQRDIGEQYGFQGLLNPKGKFCTVQQANTGGCLSAGATSLTSGGFPSLDSDPTKVATQQSYLPDDMDVQGYTGKLKYSLSNMEVQSITSYWKMTSLWSLNGAGEPINYAPPIGPFAGFNYTVLRGTDADQFSQEVRADGKYGPLTWVAGAFYSLEHRNFDSDYLDAGRNTQSDLTESSDAVFGQLNYALTDQFSLIGGIRYTREPRDIVQTDLIHHITDTAGSTDKAVTGKGGVMWQIEPDLMTYATISSGFKSGVYAQNLNTATGVISAAPESDVTYELGVKDRLWDGKASIDTDVFFNDYHDFQTTERVQIGALALGAIANAGTLRVYGLESEIKVKPIDPLSLSVGAALTHSKISSTGNGGQVNLQNTSVFYTFNDNRAPNTPTVQLNGAVRYDIPTPDFGTFGLIASGTYQTMVYLSADGDPYNIQGAYGTLDLRATWESASGRYYGDFSAVNVTNAHPSAYDVVNSSIGIKTIAWAMKPTNFSAKIGLRF